MREPSARARGFVDEIGVNSGERGFAGRLPCGAAGRNRWRV